MSWTVCDLEVSAWILAVALVEWRFRLSMTFRHSFELYHRPHLTHLACDRLRSTILSSMCVIGGGSSRWDSLQMKGSVPEEHKNTIKLFAFFFHNSCRLPTVRFLQSRHHLCQRLTKAHRDWCFCVFFKRPIEAPKMVTFWSILSSVSWWSESWHILKEQMLRTTWRPEFRSSWNPGFRFDLFYPGLNCHTRQVDLEPSTGCESFRIPTCRINEQPKRDDLHWFATSKHVSEASILEFFASDLL